MATIAISFLSMLLILAILESTTLGYTIMRTIAIQTCLFTKEQEEVLIPRPDSGAIAKTEEDERNDLVLAQKFRPQPPRLYPPF